MDNDGQEQEECILPLHVRRTSDITEMGIVGGGI